MLLKYWASMSIKSCGMRGLWSGRLVDGLGNGGNFAAVAFAVGFAFVAVFGFAFVVFGFAFACAIGFALCAVAFFAVAGFAVGFVFLAEAVGFFAVVVFFEDVVFAFAMIFLLLLSFRHLWWR